MLGKILKELVEIRKELQNIRAILQKQYVSGYTVKRSRDENGKPVRTRVIVEDPLEELRKEYNIHQ